VIGTLVLSAAIFVAGPEGPASCAAVAQAAERITAIRVHGNHISTDADVVALSGLKIGDPFTATTIAEVTAKLKAANTFDDVSVLKRFASIEDPSQILVVIIVNEGPVRVVLGEKPGDPTKVVKRSFMRNFMYMPILDWEDGYGVTFGVSIARVGVTAPTGRVSFPLTWGGLKQAGIRFDRPIKRGPFTRVEMGAVAQQQTNPAFQIDDTRQRLWARGVRSMGPWRAGVTAGWQHVDFAQLRDDIGSIGGDITFDTRLDPVLPRNAVLATASVERLGFDSGIARTRTRLDGRAYIGLVGQSVLALRALREDANDSLPPYLVSLLGGWSNLRGFAAGSFVGDTLVAGSIELRIPLTSARDIGKIGVSVFTDQGATYNKGQKLGDAIWHTGTGASVWMAATVFELGLSVAHANSGGTRVNVLGGVSF
jgi:outer membrane protein assembly factor BamA